MTRLPVEPLPAYWVDAFTQQPFTGNPAVVIPEAERLSATQMQQIAREVNCSETAFISPPTDPQADLELRWFTPAREVDLCGHATVAALHTLVDLNSQYLQPQTMLQTRSGLLAVEIETKEENKGALIWLTVPACQFQPIQAATLSAALGVELTSRDLPSVVDSLNQDVLFPIASLAELHALKPDFPTLGAIAQQQGWRGICAYCLETIESSSSAHLRFFAPHYGIAEDPVTGSVSVPLASYLQQTGNLHQPRLILEQGDCLGRSGRVQVDLSGDRPRFGGQAVTVMRGELYL
ncbi:MAG: PhzF family phenazine biosynthesis protein [Aphanocapsa sp. GSE-SYN-MK-11-07L]|jgi:PhzF family phenazine biosynthesis protein|nr:PhzF family phenazine biosynthesis protein [Aphanocapsa sp. GSE-SYN-MK-11-07L]